LAWKQPDEVVKNNTKNPGGGGMDRRRRSFVRKSNRKLSTNFTGFKTLIGVLFIGSYPITLD
jgi:hypothetical protein